MDKTSERLTDAVLAEMRRRHAITEEYGNSGQPAHPDRGVLLAEVDSLKSDLDAALELLMRIRNASEELLLCIGNDVLVEQHAEHITALASEPS